MKKYLKEKQYYVDRYDKRTVEVCRKHLEKFNHVTPSGEQSKKKDKAVLKLIGDVSIHFVAGEEYLNKRSTIERWMREDELKDNLLESAVPPSGIKCRGCSNAMEVESKLRPDSL